MDPTIVWRDRAFAELTAAELYAIIELRERVFVVEQRCAYLDADGRDPACRHVTAARGDTGELLAYLRIVPPDAGCAEPRIDLPAPPSGGGDRRAQVVAIGRVVVAKRARGTGVGRELMVRGLAAVAAQFGDAAVVRIAAQAHLREFYERLGFACRGDPFVEDGIPHIHMLRAPTARA